MVLSLPLLWTALWGCTAESDGPACPSGVREEFASTIQTVDGPVDVITTQCVTSQWTFTACAEEEGPEHCTWFFEPHTPAKAPLALIFDDFVFQHAVGDFTLSGPEVLGGSTSVFAALEGWQTQKLEEGYRVSPVQPGGLIADSPSFELQVSCDHPNTHPICPFTWDYRIVDLSDVQPGVYADFSAQYAQFVDVGNNAGVTPEEFERYEEMLGTLTIDFE